MSRKLPPEPLTRDEAEQLARVVGRGVTGIRNRALVLVLFDTGARLSEALDLESQDLDLERGSVRIRHGKGDADRVAGLGMAGERALRDWLEVRATHGQCARSPFVFCTLQGAPLMSSYVRQLLPRLGRRAGLEKRVHAHGLRHGHALHLIRAGEPLDVVSAQLGHANLETTNRYVKRMAPDERVARVRRALEQ